MTDPWLNRTREELERQVQQPDFGVVAARGRRLRRRRRLVAGAGAVTAVAATVLAVATMVGGDRAPAPPQPVDEPDRVVQDRAADVLADPGATLAPDGWAVNAAGDALMVVQAPGPASSGGCPRRSGAAFVWIGGDGSRAAWTGYATGREVAAVDGGFVVAGVDPECVGPGHAGDAEPYLVDGSGRRVPMSWDEDGPGGAALVRHCRSAVASDERCRVSLDRKTGWVAAAQPIRYPEGSIPVEVPRGSRTVWARSVGSDRLWWSQDRGTSWQSRTSTLAGAENLQVVHAGDRIGFADDTRLELTEDGGSTWTTRDLTAALASIEITDVGWTLMDSGTLLGVTGRVGGGDVLFRSRTPTSDAFVTTDVTTRVGFVYPVVAGAHVFVPDDDRWLHSPDEGRSWEVLDPFATD